MIRTSGGRLVPGSTTKGQSHDLEEQRAASISLSANANSCFLIKDLGKFKVSGGSGSKTGTADVSGYNSFFVDAYNGVNDNDSTIVSL